MRPIDDMSLDELRLEIAKRRGWTQFHIHADKTYGLPPERKYTDSRIPVPDYPRSWQAAGELLEELRKSLHIYAGGLVNCFATPETWNLVACTEPGMKQKWYEGKGCTFPEAASRTWLKWKESQK